jgi:CheY-like chemotaxis protein
MKLNELNILLADDDTDDCLFFKDAIAELIEPANFTAVHDGEQLMQLLSQEKTVLPDVLFLDLNMPRKNGFECLAEIKQHKKLQKLPVIIFSTSFEQEVVNLLYQNGAQYFIRKPAAFALFQKIILHTLSLIIHTEKSKQPGIESFVLNAENSFTI